MKNIIESHARNAYEMFLKSYYGEDTKNQERINMLLTDYLADMGIALLVNGTETTMTIEYIGMFSALATMEIKPTSIRFNIKY